MKSKIIGCVILLLVLIAAYILYVSNAKKDIIKPSYSISFYNNKIDSLMGLNRPATVKQLLDSLIFVDSNQGSHYFNRGFCNTQLLNHEAAISDFEKSISLNYKKNQCERMIKFNKDFL